MNPAWVRFKMVLLCFRTCLKVRYGEGKK